MENISLSELIPTEILQTLQDAFSDYSGLAAVIADSNGVPVTKKSNFTDFCKMTRESKKGSVKCQKCGRAGARQTLETGKPAVYQCHTGMVDFAAPIMFNDVYIGHFAGGQTRVSGLSEEFIREKAREYDIDEEEYLAAAKKNNVTDMEWVEKSATFLTHLSVALSQIANERVKIMRENELMRRTSDSQLSFMRNYADSANKGMQRFTDYLGKLANGEIKKIEETDREYLGTMNDTLQNRISSINENLVLTEIGRGEVVLKEDVYDVRLVMERKLKELKSECKKKGCSISGEIAKDVPHYLVGDSTKIAEIVNQLVESAFARGGASNLRLEVSAVQKGYGTRLMIVLADDGNRFLEDEMKSLLSRVREIKDDMVLPEDGEPDRITEVGYLLSVMSGQIDLRYSREGGMVCIVALPQLKADMH